MYMTITYRFTHGFDERHEDTYEYQYNVPDTLLAELADEYYDQECDPTADHDEFIANGGTNLEYCEDDEDFYDFVHDVMEDEARETFENDKEFWESVQEAEEYRRDPYAYNGVSRWDFV